MPARSSPRDGAPYRRQALYVPVDSAAPNDLQRRARGQRGGRYSRGRPAPRWRCRRRSPGWSATPSAERRRLLGPVVVQPPSTRRRCSARAAAMRARDSAGSTASGRAQSGPDQRREHYACGGPPPASPTPRRASGPSRATATCPSSPPRSVASSTPPRPRRPPLLAPGALTRPGPPPKIYSGRDLLRELGALSSGAACWRPSSPGPSVARRPGLDHGELMIVAGYAEQVPAQAASARA